MEIATFGWDVESMAFASIIGFVILGTIGIIAQIWKIRRYRSGESVSVTWMGLRFFFLLAAAIYGLEIADPALLVQGITRSVFVLPVMILLYRHKGFTEREWRILFASLIIICGMMQSAHQASYYLLLSYVNVVGSFSQPVEMYRNKSRGALSFLMILTFTLNSFCWGVYGYASEQFVLVWMSVPFMIVFSITLILWVYYRKNGVDSLSA